MPVWSECLQPAPVFITPNDDDRNRIDIVREISGGPVAESPVYRQPRTLMEICAQCVTSDVRLCEACLNSGLTPTLFDQLFTAAVEKRRDLSIQALISHWPFPSLSLARHGGRSAQDYERQLHRWLTGEIRQIDERDGVSTLSVIQSFINSLRKREPSRLRVLDLRGFPCVDYGIEYLTGHSMLAYNESQRAGIIRLVQEMATNQRITREQASAFGDLADVHTTLPEHSYAVIVDCVIESEGRPLVELCKALKISPYSHAHLKLIVNQLHLCGVGGQYVDLIMPLLDPTYLVGLNLSLNGLQTSGMNHVLASLEVGKFDALHCLDLSLNQIDFSLSDLACQQFSTTFARLRQLKRLDLGGNRLSRRLRTLFTPPSTLRSRTGFSSASAGQQQPSQMDQHENPDDFSDRRLEYLNLSGCRLMESDFIFLSNTTLISEILQLDLSDNDFSSSTSSLCCILKKIRSTIRSLKLERCKFRNQQADRIIGAHLASMTSLIGLNIADNAWSTEIYREEMPKLIKGCTALGGIRISYPIECYQVQQGDQGDEEQQQLAMQMRKTSFYCNLTRLMEQAKVASRPFRLVCVDLDEALV